MSLQWISLNIKDFIANTVRLNAEAKGAYVMLLLDYYEQEEGPPADPDVLATVAGLSPEAWARHAKVILPLFEVREGRLYQTRVEDEIAKAHRMIAQRQEAADKSSAARAARRGQNDPSTTRSTGAERPLAPKSPPKQRVENGPVNEPSSDPLASLRSFTTPFNGPSSEPLNGPSTHIQEQIEVVGSYEPTSALVETLLSPDFVLSGADIIRCQNDGATVAQISAVFDGWKIYNLSAGTFSNDWAGSWWRRWDRDKPVADPKSRAKPRVEVTRKVAKPIPAEWKPSESHEAIATELGLNLDSVEQTFRDYCASSGKKYIDHDAAFRNFLRNQPTFTRRGPPNGQAPARRAPAPDRGSITGAADEAIANLDRAIEAAESRDAVRQAPVRSLSDQRLRPPEGGAGVDGQGAE